MGNYKTCMSCKQEPQVFLVINHFWLLAKKPLWKESKVFSKGIKRNTIQKTNHVSCEHQLIDSPSTSWDSKRDVYLTIACDLSVTQRQKFHTDDVKSVQNRVRSADWSTE